MAVNAPAMIRASGLWDMPPDPGAVHNYRAFASRPWAHRSCTIDEIILHTVEWDADFLRQLNMALAMGEADLDKI